MIKGKSQSERSVVRPLGGLGRVRAGLWMQGRAVSSLESGKWDKEMRVEADTFVELVSRGRKSYFL